MPSTKHLEHWAMSDFKENLLGLRKERRLTQMQLADLLDVQPRLISRWETGQSKPHFDHVVKIAEVLEVTLDQLIHGESDEKSAFQIRNKRLQELCRQIDHLGKDDQEVICHVMDSLIRKEQIKAIVGSALPATAE